MVASLEIYLDVETDWQRRLTVIGFYSPVTGLVQLVGPQINTANLRAALPAEGTLYTFNGHSFDLPCLEQQLGVRLRQQFHSIDLRWSCRRQGLKGGQKRIEQMIGYRRILPELSGYDAMVLWGRYQRGDARALSTLLQYNGEDLTGMMRIKAHLDRLASATLPGMV